MIAYCTACKKSFVPRSTTPRCPTCHATRNLKYLEVADLDQVLDDHFKSTGSANREPGPASSNGSTPSRDNDAAASAVIDGTGERPQREERSAATSTRALSSGASLPRSPARAEGPEDTSNPPSGDGTRRPPTFLDMARDEPHVDVLPIKRAFFGKGWDRKPRLDQLILIRDALRGAGLALLASDVDSIDAMREAWLEERGAASSRSSSIVTCDWILNGSTNDRVLPCGATKIVARCQSCGRPLCHRHATIHARRSPDHRLEWVRPGGRVVSTCGAYYARVARDSLLEDLDGLLELATCTKPLGHTTEHGDDVVVLDGVRI